LVAMVRWHPTTRRRPILRENLPVFEITTAPGRSQRLEWGPPGRRQPGGRLARLVEDGDGAEVAFAPQL